MDSFARRRLLVKVARRGYYLARCGPDAFALARLWRAKALSRQGFFLFFGQI